MCVRWKVPCKVARLFSFQRINAMTIRAFNVLYVFIVKLGLLSKFVAILVG